MPKIAIDYQNTLIYKFVCNDLNITDTYVGHTTNFIQRKRCHKGDCNNENSKSYNYKIYITIRENGGWPNWSMIEIEKYPCLDINEACARERYWFEILNAKMNTCYPNRTKKEWIEANKEQIAEQKKDYYNNNKEQVAEYRELNKDKIAEQKKNIEKQINSI